jgi:hypothetical protein
MKRRCAWCGKDMGSKEPQGDGGITHGMCLLCSEGIIRAAERDVEASTSPPGQGPEADAPAPVKNLHG